MHLFSITAKIVRCRTKRTQPKKGKSHFIFADIICSCEAVKSTWDLTDNTKKNQNPKNQPHNKSNKQKNHKATANRGSLKHNNVDFDITDISQSKLCQEE